MHRLSFLAVLCVALAGTPALARASDCPPDAAAGEAAALVETVSRVAQFVEGRVQSFAERSAANATRWRADVEHAAREAGIASEEIERQRSEIDRRLRVEIRTGADGLLGFLRDKTYKIAGEVPSNGHANAGAHYVEMVRRVEGAQGFAGERVIYGSLAWGDAPDAQLARYGDVVLVLRNDAITSRVVLTGEDSFNYFERVGPPSFDEDVAIWSHAPDLALHHRLVRQPRLRAQLASDPSYRHYGLYPEVRILGGLTTDDVEAILVPDSPSWDDAAQQAQALAAGTGIEVRRVPASPVASR